MIFKTLTAVSLAVACMAANAVTTTSVNGAADQTIHVSFGAGTVSGSVFSNGFDITSISFVGPVIATWSQLSSSVLNLGPAGNLLQEQWTLGPTSLTAGNYDLIISGVGQNNQVVTSYTGSYSYTPQTLSAPVPEPESYAMLLAGLGALGFMGRRRGRREA